MFHYDLFIINVTASIINRKIHITIQLPLPNILLQREVNRPNKKDALQINLGLVAHVFNGMFSFVPHWHYKMFLVAHIFCATNFSLKIPIFICHYDIRLKMLQFNPSLDMCFKEQRMQFVYQVVFYIH